MGAREGSILARFVCVLLGLPLLLQLELGAEAGRSLIVCTATKGEVKSAQAKLPLCDYKHHNIGVDCSGWLLGITSEYVGQAEIAPPAPSGGAAMPDPDPSPAHYAIPSPPPPIPCTSRGQVPGFHYWPPIGQPPALRNEGIDCFNAPPSPALEHVNHAEIASTAYTTSSGRHHLSHSQAALPPWDFAGAIPVWNCNNPPKGTLPPALPPCGFKHRRPGFDCLPRDGYSPGFFTAESSPAAASKTIPASDPHSAHGRHWPELPPCNFPGAIPGWDCFDPPTGDLPPCDFRSRESASTAGRRRLLLPALNGPSR